MISEEPDMREALGEITRTQQNGTIQLLNYRYFELLIIRRIYAVGFYRLTP